MDDKPTDKCTGNDPNCQIPEKRKRPGCRGEAAEMKKLTRLAMALGASHAALISTKDICIQEELAALCTASRCDSYGLSASCPPHVGGPAAFRSLKKNYQHALVFKIDVPTEMLLSSERQEVFKMLHEIAARIETKAAALGFTRARAFAGGSCKNLFCRDHRACRVVSAGGDCRHPHRARPSMSGFGINVKKLQAAAGWEMVDVTSAERSDDNATGSVTGLILIG